jgi:hypothetical protein
MEAEDTEDTVVGKGEEEPILAKGRWQQPGKSLAN